MGQGRKLDWCLSVSRRGFLGLSSSLIGSLIPARLRGTPLPKPAPFDSPPGANEPPLSDYRLRPRYRANSPLDDIFRYIEPGLDEFISEKYAEEIEAIVGKWSALLTASLSNLNEITAFLTSSFQGCNLQPFQVGQLRCEPNLEIWRRHFSGPATLGREFFIQELKAFLSPFTKLITAEFKVCGISVQDGSPRLLEWAS